MLAACRVSSSRTNDSTNAPPSAVEARRFAESADEVLPGIHQRQAVGSASEGFGADRKQK